MKKRNLIEKIPNWLRYIIAIPASLIGTILIIMFINFNTMLFSDTNSLWYSAINFILANFVSVLVFFLCLNYILPKYKFIFTLILSILLLILIYCLLIFSTLSNNLSTQYVIGNILFSIGCVISCYLSKKEKFNE